MTELIVIHYKKSRLAMAPDEIFGIQKLYGRYKYDLIFNNDDQLIEMIAKYLKENKIIIVHFHNMVVDHPIFINDRIKKIIHYHSEPTNENISYENGIKTKLVLNQYHCLLDEYKDCNIVRNFFNWNADPVFYKNKIKISFSPSIIKEKNVYWDKGYSETISILGKIRQKHGVLIDVIINTSYANCINRKKDSHIIIDECKTGSFHKCTVEGLILGAVVFVNINEDLMNKHKKEYGQLLPIVNCDMNSLEKKLEEHILLGKKKLETLAIENRKKFLSYWNARNVCQEYDDVYDRLFIMSNKVRGVNHSKRNWGDSINSYLFKELSSQECNFITSDKIKIDDPHYLICGSIMRLSNKNSIIWGTGFISQKDSIGLGSWKNCNSIVGEKPLKICAVRGCLTKEKLNKMGIECPTVYGDPALLFKYFYNQSKEKRYKYGIIPHYVDKECNYIKSLNRSKIKIIDICIKNDGSIFDIIDEICECEIIFSSTLHGLILGDVYCKKSYYIKLSDKVEGGDFKFRDYFSSVNRKFICLCTRDLDDILKNDNANNFIDKYQYDFKFNYRSFIKSCPFIEKVKKDDMLKFYYNTE